MKIPKRPLSLNGMIEEAENALANMERSACTFWACEGPARPRHMITCTRCWAIRGIQRLIRHLKSMKANRGNTRSRRRTLTQAGV